MRAYVFVRTPFNYNRPFKCVWRGNIETIPADGSSLVIRRDFVAERVESTMYDVTKGCVEIYMDVLDVTDEDYPEIKRFWSRWPHWWPIKLHNNKKVWWRYPLPRRLTLKSNPRVHRWLWFVW